jgi:GT2 family glycosyltransferase
LKYEIPQQVLVLQTNKDFSYASGVNRGIRASTTNNIVLLNDDCFVKDKWLSSLLRVAESEPKAGIVGGKLLHPNGHILDTGAYISVNGESVPVISQSETAHPVNGYLECGLLIKRKTITDIGLFDESYSPFEYEDADFCYRARSKGWLVYYCPESEVYHIGGATIQKANKDYFKSVVERNKKLFLERWGELLKNGSS